VSPDQNQQQQQVELLKKQLDSKNKLIMDLSMRLVDVGRGEPCDIAKAAD
jgi:hypothetical protein